MLARILHLVIVARCAMLVRLSIPKDSCIATTASQSYLKLKISAVEDCCHKLEHRGHENMGLTDAQLMSLLQQTGTTKA
jgi:hypothetical protein